MNNNPPLLVPGVLAKTLSATCVLVIVGFAVALRVYGTLAVRDIVGTLISATIFAYLVHLWIVMGSKQYRKDGQD